MVAVDVAHQLDISQSAYNKWESGQTKPTLNHLKKISEIFDTDFYGLLNELLPNVDLSNAKFENSPCLVFDSTINFQNQDILSKILENQNQISDLVANQNKLFEHLINQNK